MLRHFNALYIYILMFHPTLLVPVEAIMTMIRAIKIDHGTNPECSLFGIHIVLYWDGPLGGILGHFACF